MNLVWRFHRSTARALAVLLLVTGWGAPLAFPHLADDDLLCLVDIASEGEPSRLKAAAAVASEDHCAICHTQRSFRAARLNSAQDCVVLASSRIVSPVLALGRSRPGFRRLPARAPPA